MKCWKYLPKYVPVDLNFVPLNLTSPFNSSRKLFCVKMTLTIFGRYVGRMWRDQRLNEACWRKEKTFKNKKAEVWYNEK